MKVEVQCDYCGRTFLREKKQLNQKGKMGYKCYCSKKCQHDAKTTSVEVTCATCGTKIMRSPHELEKSKSGNVYCSHKCARAGVDNSAFPSGEEHHNFKNGHCVYRDKALEYYGAKCSVCGYDVESVLEVHHRDCNRKNNTIENLDVLCPTHHKEYQLGIRKYAGMVKLADAPDLSSGDSNTVPVQVWLPVP